MPTIKDRVNVLERRRAPIPHPFTVVIMDRPDESKAQACARYGVSEFDDHVLIIQQEGMRYADDNQEPTGTA